MLLENWSIVNCMLGWKDLNAVSLFSMSEGLAKISVSTT